MVTKDARTEPRKSDKKPERITVLRSDGGTDTYEGEELRFTCEQDNERQLDILGPGNYAVATYADGAWQRLAYEKNNAGVKVKIGVAPHDPKSTPFGGIVRNG